MSEKRVFLDPWTLLEKVCLACAINKFGRNWQLVCNFIGPKLSNGRPDDWFTPETCEAQYNRLLKKYYNPSIRALDADTQVVECLREVCRRTIPSSEEQTAKIAALKKRIRDAQDPNISPAVLKKHYEDAKREAEEREYRAKKYEEFIKKRKTLKEKYERGEDIGKWKKKRNELEKMDCGVVLDRKPGISGVNSPSKISDADAKLSVLKMLLQQDISKFESFLDSESESASTSFEVPSKVGDDVTSEVPSKVGDDVTSEDKQNVTDGAKITLIGKAKVGEHDNNGCISTNGGSTVVVSPLQTEKDQRCDAFSVVSALSPSKLENAALTVLESSFSNLMTTKVENAPDCAGSRIVLTLSELGNIAAISVSIPVAIKGISQSATENNISWISLICSKAQQTKSIAPWLSLIPPAPTSEEKIIDKMIQICFDNKTTRQFDLKDIEWLTDYIAIECLLKIAGRSIAVSKKDTLIAINAPQVLLKSWWENGVFSKHPIAVNAEKKLTINRWVIEQIFAALQEAIGMKLETVAKGLSSNVINMEEIEWYAVKADDKKGIFIPGYMGGILEHQGAGISRVRFIF